MAYYINERCVSCQKCKVECPVGAITLGADRPVIDEERCICCGTCASICNLGAAVDLAAPAVEVRLHPLIEKSCDLVVLGGGGTGLVAAARAAWLGVKKIIVLEKNVKTGGGAWFAADFKVFQSRWQRERGIPDVLEKSLNEAMDQTYWKLDPHLAERCYRATGAFFDWLCESGTQVADQFQTGFYIFDGPSGPSIPVFQKMRHGKQGGTGKFVMDQMLELCRKHGVEVRTETAADELIVEQGRIRGVMASDAGGRLKINCKACILATGSWINNQSVLTRVAPQFASFYTCRSAHRSPMYTGDGIRLAEQAGAFIDYDNFCLRLMGPLTMAADGTPYRTFASMSADPSVIYVNQEGKRWINEEAPGRVGFFHTAETMLRQPGGISYTIFDTNCIKRAVQASVNGEHPSFGAFPLPGFPEDWETDLDKAVREYAPWVKKADTLEELAQELGLSERNLKETVERYNRLCEQRKDEDFFKNQKYLVPLIEGPYYGAICNMATDGAFGGVKVNARMEVLDLEGKPIHNFYAGGDFTSSRYINQGGVKIQIINDLAWAFASGYLAAESAAEDLKLE